MCFMMIICSQELDRNNLRSVLCSHQKVNRSTRTTKKDMTERDRIAQLEGTSKDHLVQWPDLFRSNQQLKPVNEGIVQMSLEH